MFINSNHILTPEKPVASGLLDILQELRENVHAAMLEFKVKAKERLLNFNFRNLLDRAISSRLLMCSA